MTQVVVNAGCGVLGGGHVPQMFEPWRQIRVDIDPTVQPDVLADITDLSAIPDATADALWSSHCLEHLYAHDVVVALREFGRVLKGDGFLCALVPDLQVVARMVAEDRMHEVLYQSAAGPITAHDVIFGFGSAIAAGRVSMAHHCGFTPSAMMRYLSAAGFTSYALRRRQGFELALLARKLPTDDPSLWDALFAGLGL